MGSLAHLTSVDPWVLTVFLICYVKWGCSSVDEEVLQKYRHRVHMNIETGNLEQALVLSSPSNWRVVLLRNRMDEMVKKGDDAFES